MGSISTTDSWQNLDNSEIEALIVGGGFSGIYSLYQLRQNGIEARILEATDQIGGVWHFNNYPGARVDSEVPYYQYSINEVWKDWDWQERFPGQKEIKAYFQHTANVLDLYKDIAFNSTVTDCDFDTDSQKWTIKTSAGKSIKCKYLIVAAGTLNKAHAPEFTDLDKYGGKFLHSSNFPEEPFDFSDKKVAIIGQGATGIQITQEVSKVAEKLTVFIRTPNIALPMRQRKLTHEEQFNQKSAYPFIFQLCRETKAGMPYWSDGKKTKEATPEERQARWQELWDRGGFNFNLAGYSDVLTDQEANDLMYEFWKNKVRERITDPRKRDIMAPHKPPHPVATKRPSLEQDYYECIDRPNVDLVNLKEVDIERFDKDGIVTSDGEHRHFDVVIFATGYDAVTGSLTAMGLRDVSGTDLKDRWKEGVRTHLGITVPGFPNMFMVYSPQGMSKSSRTPDNH